MSTILKVSEAASLALHASCLLAARPEDASPIRELAGFLGVSENHLSKVLQRLAKAGLVRSTRGPQGGFQLARAPEEVSLLEVYETVEGPLEGKECLLERPVCSGDCILGPLLHTLDRSLKAYLGDRTLADFAASFPPGKSAPRTRNQAPGRPS